MINGAGKLQGEGGVQNGLNKMTYRDTCQIEKLSGDQEVILNFNGLSEWQHFNGVTMNQGCGSVNSTDGASSSSTKMMDY